MTKKPLHPLKAIALCLLIMPWHGCFGTQQNQIKINYGDNKTTSIAYKPEKTIAEVKTELVKIANIPFNRQKLMFSGQALRNRDTLQENNIKNTDALYLTTWDHPQELFVETPMSKTITLDYDPQDTIQEIKEEIQDKEGIPPQQQKLTFKQQQLGDDGQTLQQYNVPCRSTLDLQLSLRKYPPPPSPNNINENNNNNIINNNNNIDDADITDINDNNSNKDKKIELEQNVIYIKTLEDKIITLDYDPQDTIQEIKQALQEKEGWPSEQQVLIFAGKQLEDNKTLGDYGAQLESTVRIVLHRPLNYNNNNNIDDADITDIDDNKINNNNEIKNNIINPPNNHPNKNKNNEIKDNNNNEINDNNNDNNNTTTYVVITLGIIGILGIGYLVHNKSTQKPTNARDTSKQAT